MPNATLVDNNQVPLGTAGNPLVTSGGGGGGTSLTPSSSAGVANTPVKTSVAASSLVVKAGAGNLYTASCTAAIAGYLMVFDATSAPADGTVTPTLVAAVGSGQTVEIDHSVIPDRFATGITLVFSTTGPFTKTASATAFMEAGAQ